MSDANALVLLKAHNLLCNACYIYARKRAMLISTEKQAQGNSCSERGVRFLYIVYTGEWRPYRRRRRRRLVTAIYPSDQKPRSRKENKSCAHRSSWRYTGPVSALSCAAAARMQNRLTSFFFSHPSALLSLSLSLFELKTRIERTHKCFGWLFGQSFVNLCARPGWKSVALEL